MQLNLCCSRVNYTASGKGKKRRDGEGLGEERETEREKEKRQQGRVSIVHLLLFIRPSKQLKNHRTIVYTTEETTSSLCYFVTSSKQAEAAYLSCHHQRQPQPSSGSSLLSFSNRRLCSLLVKHWGSRTFPKETWGEKKQSVKT